jgi:hypothetical protein
MVFSFMFFVADEVSQILTGWKAGWPSDVIEKRFYRELNPYKNILID